MPRRYSSNVVSTPSPRQVRNSIRSAANFYSITPEQAKQGLLDLGISPEREEPRSRVSLESGSNRPPRTESSRAGGELIIAEHDIQKTLYGLLQRDKRVSWVGRFNSGKFRLQSSPGQPDRWFAASTVIGLSDMMGCLVSDGGAPGRMFAFEVKERSLAARRAVAQVIAEVDAGLFDEIKSTEAKGRIAAQYAFLLKVRRGGGIGEFVFDVDEAMALLR